MTWKVHSIVLCIHIINDNFVRNITTETNIHHTEWKENEIFVGDRFIISYIEKQLLLYQ